MNPAMLMSLGQLVLGTAGNLTTAADAATPTPAPTAVVQQEQAYESPEDAESARIDALTPAELDAEVTERLCFMDARIARAESTIAFQKKVGKTTGVVNAAILHSAGSELVHVKAEKAAGMKMLKAENKNFKYKCDQQ